MTAARWLADCALCTLGLAPPDVPLEEAEVMVAYVDEEVLILVDPAREGALFAPRVHVGSLSELGDQAGRLLAALRRVAIEVQAIYGTTGTMIEPTTDLPGAAGHVCYHVIPTLRLNGPSPPRHLAAEARRLAAAVGGRGTVRGVA